MFDGKLGWASVSRASDTPCPIRLSGLFKNLRPCCGPAGMEMIMRKVLLYIGAAVTFLFSMLHLFFSKIGNWSIELKRLSPDNQGIIQALNIGSIYFLLFCAIITVLIAGKPVLDGTDKLFIVLVAGYYVLRIAVGFPLFGVSVEEILIQIVCLLVACCYLVPLKLK